MKLDIKDPKPGLYRLTRTVMHEKPDGRAARGWDSREGVPENTLVRVRVEKSSSLGQSLSQPRVVLSLPGRYYRSVDVTLDQFDHNEQYAPSARTLRAITDALVLYTEGDGRLALIRNDGRYAWDGVILTLLESGTLTDNQVRAACDAFDAAEDARLEAEEDA